MITTVNNINDTLGCIKKFLSLAGDKAILVDEEEFVVTLVCDLYKSKFRLSEINLNKLKNHLDSEGVFYNKLSLKEFSVDTFTGRFKLNEKGVWDSDSCFECCSDCSACEEGCICPRVFEGTCNNCIFKDGYKKCSQCCINPRTENEEHYQTGLWHMCDSCINGGSK